MGLAGLYGLYALVMIWLHPQFMYPFGADVFAAPGYTVETLDDGVVLAKAEGQGETAVVFFMGNGGSLMYFTGPLEAHRAAGRPLTALAYRGGGGVPGVPSERQLKADALAAYDAVAARHTGPIVVHGYSMGTALALHVAAQRPVQAVLLDAPFVRMCELMTRAAYLPACWLPGVQKWDSARDAARVSAPVLIQHGVLDQAIPMRDGERLAGLLRAAGADVVFTPVPTGTHNNLSGVPGYTDRITDFLDGVQP